MSIRTASRTGLSPTSFYIAAAVAAALTIATAVAAPRAAPADRFAPPTAAELGFSGARAQQWEALRQEGIALRRIGRDDVAGGIGDLRALLDQPNPDLRAFSNDAQHRVDAHMAQMRELRERQLDFYDALSPAEQAALRAAMAQRIDRLSQLRQRLAGAFDLRQ